METFEAYYAIKYGLSCAVILNKFQFFLQKNLVNKKQIHEKRVWFSISIKALKKLFPYFTDKQIRGSLENLIKSGVLLKGNFSENKTDRTTFYSFSNQQDFLDFTFIEDSLKDSLLPFCVKNNSI